MLRIGFILLLVSLPLRAAEDCPVSKISLARGLACEVYRLLNQATPGDTKIDAICLKLGRVSAIWRRTQGQLKKLPTAPIPPAKWKERAIQLEGFCGVGNDTTLPRGLLNAAYLYQDTGFRQYMRERITETSQWIRDNKDAAEAECLLPGELSAEDAAECLG